MNFLHLSDSHFLVDYHQNHDVFRQVYLEMTSTLVQLEQLLQNVKAPIDFILHTGDVSHEGGEQDYRSYLEGIAKICGDVPLLVTPGNHDLDREAFCKVLAPMQSGDKPFFQLYQQGELNIVSFDNTDPLVPSGAVSDEICGLLLDYFCQYPNTPTILMSHHHFLSEQFTLTPTTVPKKFEQVLQQPNIVGIFTGHAHHQYKGTLGGKPYYTADSLSFSAENILGGLRIEERSGIHFCQYDQGQLEVVPIGGKRVTRILGEVQR